MGDDFRQVGDDKILNPAVWMAKQTSEEDWDADIPTDTLFVNMDGSENPGNDPELVDFTPPNGGSSNAPVIYSMSPAGGPPGTVVTLTGINFLGAGQIQPPNTLEFNNSVPGRAASFSILSATTIKCTVPDGAIDGRIALHSWDPANAADVITLSPNSFDVQSGSVAPPPQSPADPSVKIHWDAFTIDGSPTLHGAVTVNASQPMQDVLIDAVLGSAVRKKAYVDGFYAWTRQQETNPGTSKGVVINTGLFAVGSVNPPKYINQGNVFVRATFKIGTKIRVVRKRAVVRTKNPYFKGQVMIDTVDYQVWLVPPTMNPLAEFIHPEWEGTDEVTAMAVVAVKKGTLMGGNFTFKLWSENGGSQQASFTLAPGSKGRSAVLMSKVQNLGVQDFWGAQVISGTISIKDSQGTTHQYPLATGVAGALNAGSSAGGLDHDSGPVN